MLITGKTMILIEYYPNGIIWINITEFKFFDVLKISQFYLYSPISQITICLKELCNLYSIQNQVLYGSHTVKQSQMLYLFVIMYSCNCTEVLKCGWMERNSRCRISQHHFAHGELCDLIHTNTFWFIPSSAIFIRLFSVWCRFFYALCPCSTVRCTCIVKLFECSTNSHNWNAAAAAAVSLMSSLCALHRVSCLRLSTACQTEPLRPRSSWFSWGTWCSTSRYFNTHTHTHTYKHCIPTASTHKTPPSQ